MKVKKHSRAADTKPLPVCFDLNETEHVKAVQLLAMASAMDTAFLCASGQCTCKQMRLAHHFGPMQLPLLVGRFVEAWCNKVTDGKRGTNDPEQFTALFATVVPRVYPAFL